MTQINTGWKYYLPDNGETAADATAITLYKWAKGIWDAEDAAVLAAKHEWDRRGGAESGINSKSTIAVIAPDDAETRWQARHEVEIAHYVESIK